MIIAWPHYSKTRTFTSFQTHLCPFNAGSAVYLAVMASGLTPILPSSQSSKNLMVLSNDGLAEQSHALLPVSKFDFWYDAIVAND